MWAGAILYYGGTAYENKGGLGVQWDLESGDTGSAKAADPAWKLGKGELA